MGGHEATVLVPLCAVVGSATTYTNRYRLSAAVAPAARACAAWQFRQHILSAVAYVGATTGDNPCHQQEELNMTFVLRTTISGETRYVGHDAVGFYAPKELINALLFPEEGVNMTKVLERFKATVGDDTKLEICTVSLTPITGDVLLNKLKAVRDEANALPYGNDLVYCLDQAIDAHENALAKQQELRAEATAQNP
jgi:hypothetical protein